MFRDKKSQQQTLSIRVSESVREFLDRARKQFSESRSENMSISDVAKALLESAIENQMDARLETTFLMAEPTDTLLKIRRKWESAQELTRAEWIVLAQYVQSACEELSSDPELPSRESFADILEAFLKVRSLRRHPDPGRDDYYLGNLRGSTGQAAGARSGGGTKESDIIPVITRRLVQDLRESSKSERPTFAARNLYVALREEQLTGADALNRALSPFLPRLYSLAARGHWLTEHKPIRQERRAWQPLGFIPDYVPNVQVGDFVLSSVVSRDGELDMMLNLNPQRVAYSLGPYPEIKEFQAMLNRVPPARTWDGHYFFGHHDQSTSAEPQTDPHGGSFHFREHGKGILVMFTEKEWAELKDLMNQAMNLPQLQVTLKELSLQYGEF